MEKSAANFRGVPAAKSATSAAPSDRHQLHLSIQAKLDFLADKHFDYYRGVLEEANRSQPVPAAATTAIKKATGSQATTLKDYINL